MSIPTRSSVRRQVHPTGWCCQSRTQASAKRCWSSRRKESDSMSKIRIHEYAKENGVSSKEVVEFLQNKGIEANSHMKSLEDEEITVLNKKFKKNTAKPEAGKEKKPAQSKSQGQKSSNTSGNKQNQSQNKGQGQNRGSNNKGQGQNRGPQNKRNQKNRHHKPGQKGLKKNQNQKPAPKKEVELPKEFKYQEGITVGELAEKIGVDASKIVKDLFMVGVMTNINQSLDNDSVELIASDHGFTAELEVVVDNTDLENYFELGDDLDEERPS